MFKIQEYVIPNSLDEAYEILQARKNNTILGGTLFLRMGSQNIGKGIDLNQLDLNFICENEGYIEIGAMTTFRELETSPLLKNYCNGIIPKAIHSIIGVQFRNLVTVGATVYSRYGFSDLITALLALDVEVELFQVGRIPLAEFLANTPKKDILVKILIKKEQCNGSFQSLRNSAVDYAILNVAVAKVGQDWRIAVGARPGRAILAEKAAEYLAQSSLKPEDIENAAKIASNELAFGSNMRGSAEYRKEMSKVLVKRAIAEVLEWK